MAAPLSTALDVHLTDPKRTAFFNSPQRRHPIRKCTVSCNSSSRSSSKASPISREEKSLSNKKSSLSDQLRPLTDVTLSDSPSANQYANVLSRPKSTWVNPTKPKRSVLSLQRQKRSPYSHNPHLRDLLHIAHKLNNCEQSDFLAMLEDIPQPITKENGLIVLNGLKEWEKTLLFFNWLKTQKSFPMETIFYNVTMKYLRYGRQFQIIEDLANEMISTGIELDNITYSTIISCAKKSGQFDKAVEWFERMYKTGLIPDEVTYSTILDVYGRLGKVEEVLNLYERGRASGWKPDQVTFTVLAKMFGEAGDYDGIRYILQEMKSVELPPNLVVYNTLLEAMGKAGKPGFARRLFEEMIEAGITPNEKTLTALVKIYGKSRWARDALELWEQMREKNWPMDFILYNTLLNMCADLGLVEQAEKLFGDMKKGERGGPDSWSYTAMLRIYGSLGDVENAEKLFDELSELGIELNVMGSTCLIQCLGKARKFDGVVRVFGISVERGVKPDDRLCGCLLSVVSLCQDSADEDKVLSCLEQANPKLVSFVHLLLDDKTMFEIVKKEFKGLMSSTAVDARRAFCNCFIDICRNKNLLERAHELLYLGTLYGLYPGLHDRRPDSWCLDVRSLSVGAAQTALEEWLGTLSRIIQREEQLPELLSARTGTGQHKFSQGLANSFASHVKKLSAPFQESEKVGWFVASREDLISWVRSRVSTPAIPT